MDEQSEAQEARKTPPVTKRTPRMMHESSFATSAFTSGRGQKRPPGFIASSLDYKSGTAATAAATVTTKPGRNNKNNQNKQQQEQLEREQQYQQQRQQRSGHPTRAQGNFGPPPHSVKTLEDLENMSEEQIYKLFMDDPELHQAFIKAAEKGEYGSKNAPTSAPAGARKARRPAGKKSSSSSKSRRNNSKPKVVKFKDIEREVPYFQWLFLFVLIGISVYKMSKPFSDSNTTNDNPKNAKGRKQKKKVEKAQKKLPAKKNSAQERKSVSSVEIDKVGPSVVKKKASPKKKKKKPSKPAPKIVLEKTIDVQKEEEPDSDTDSTDGSSQNREPEPKNLKPVVQETIISSFSTIDVDDDDDTWQTVTKTSKGGKRGSTTTDSVVVEENNVEEEEEPGEEKRTVEESVEPVVEGKSLSDEPVVEVAKEDAVEKDPPKPEPTKPVVEPSPEESGFIVKKKRNRKKRGKGKASNTQRESNNPTESTPATTNGASHTVENNEKKSEVKPSEKTEIGTEGVSATKTKDDAALALDLHKEEVNMARAANGNPQEEAWEEVTTRKKKSI